MDMIGAGGAAERERGGWRAGKPLEDPEKIKRWGRIGARPSEYLIHMRRGRVLTQSSGQGASCFKWPWDSVTLVPTTVQELKFSAEQITSEKIGVEVTGLAVYRIAEPLIAYRMLNFSFPERASEKLAGLLVDMFVGAARRLVANLTLEDCLARRKEGIAVELMREIGPVVSGQGMLDDATDRGWGVVLDTIEIQDVRVLSESVFQNLQAGFRKEQERRAREAALSADRALERAEAEAARAIALTRIAADRDVEEQRREAGEQSRLSVIASAARLAEAELAHRRGSEQAKLETDRELAAQRLAVERELRRAKQACEDEALLERALADARLCEAKLEHERRLSERATEAAVEKVRLEADAGAARHRAALSALTEEAERVSAGAELAEARRRLAEAEVSLAELEAKRAAHAQELELSQQRALRAIENTISRELIELTVARELPRLAAAFQQQMGEVHVTAVDGANPFGYVAAAVEGVLGLARSAGLRTPPANGS